MRRNERRNGYKDKDDGTGESVTDRDEMNVIVL